MSRPISEAEWREFRFKLTGKSDMELYEEAQKMKPLDQYDVAKDKKAEEIAEREGYLSDAELIEEGKIQAARELHIKMVGRTGEAKPKPRPTLCPFIENRFCLIICPLYIEHEAMCSHKLTAISLAQIANILATGLFSRRQ